MADTYDHQVTTSEAYSKSKMAKVLSTIALLAAILALIVSFMALSKAGDAQSTANRATESVQQSE